jgi:hypothetical protein
MLGYNPTGWSYSIAHQHDSLWLGRCDTFIIELLFGGLK